MWDVVYNLDQVCGWQLHHPGPAAFFEFVLGMDKWKNDLLVKVYE